jgi:hypothetical protein
MLMLYHQKNKTPPKRGFANKRYHTFYEVHRLEHSPKGDRKC